MIGGVSNAQRMLYDAASDNVDRLLKSWREQIEADYQLILKAGEKLRQDDDAARQLAQRQAQQQAMDAALDHAVADYVENLLSKAQSVDVGALQLPGIRSVSGVSSGAMAEISALASEVMEANLNNADGNPELEARRSALGALERGLVPHPGDLSTVQHAKKLDLAFAQHFAELGQKIERLDGSSFKHPRLKVDSGLQRLNLLRDYGDHLNAYGSDRLIQLVGKPEMLVGVPTPALPLRSQRTSMPEREFNQMLTNLFAKPRKS